jgi:hypothetical protein
VFWRWRGARYTLKVCRTQAPEISVTQPGRDGQELARDAQSAAIALSVQRRLPVSARPCT